MYQTISSYQSGTKTESYSLSADNSQGYSTTSYQPASSPARLSSSSSPAGCGAGCAYCTGCRLN